MPFEDEEDEGREVKIRRRPQDPTRAERIKHRITHLPYRSWCPDCVAGKGRDHHHRAVQEDQDARGVDEVHLDYCFPRDGVGLPSRTVVVAKSRKTKAVFCHVVTTKGIGGIDWAVQQLCKDIVRLGIHGKVILKTDQEHALVDLAREVARSRGPMVETVIESAPRSDSSGHGLAERAVQAIECQIRVMKCSLERRLGRVRIQPSISMPKKRH